MRWKTRCGANVVYVARMDPGPVLVYDGDCALCSRLTRFVLRRDRAGVFRFAARDSEAGRRLLLRAGLRGPPPEYLVLVEGARTFIRSDAVLRVGRLLGGPWAALAAAGRLVPRALRDAAYDFIARRRRSLARAPRCETPSAALRARLLDDQPGAPSGSR